MSEPMLPPELIDHIFSFLQGDSLALKACSKVQPLFSRLAERHLYAHIVISPRAPDVSNLIFENPHLLNYPRTLEINHHPNNQNPLAISIMQMIPRMTNLTSLKIYDPCPYKQRGEFFSAFRNYLPQISLQELS